MYKVGNKIELVHLDQVIKNEKNRKVYVSKIFDILPNNILQIAMPIYEGKIVPLNINDKYSVTFYTKMGLVQCNVVITARYKKGNLFIMEVMMLSELSKVQRREFYRYKCLLDAKLRIVSDEEYDSGINYFCDISEDELEWEDVKILDVSGGGAKILGRNHIDKNEVIKIKFNVSIVDEFLKFNLYGRILGSSRYNGRTDVYELRLEFMKISLEDRDRLVKFIFESERRALSKGVPKK